MDENFDDGEGLDELSIRPARRATAGRYETSSVGSRDVSSFRWDSEAEREFGQAVAKYLASDVQFRPGENARTRIGTFRPDMILAHGNRTVGLEVDGEAFHVDKHRDWLRDAALLDAGVVQVIYRFSAATTWYRTEDCVFVLARYEPGLVDCRARESLLPRLASSLVRDCTHYPDDGLVVIRDFLTELQSEEEVDSDLGPWCFGVDRRTLNHPMISRVAAWIAKHCERYPNSPFQTRLESFKRAERKAAGNTIDTPAGVASQSPAPQRS